jgi:hypothetical protein
LALQINDLEVENILKKQFQNVNEMTNYLYDLVKTDIEDRRLMQILTNESCEDFVSKQEVFKALDDV